MAVYIRVLFKLNRKNLSLNSIESRSSDTRIKRNVMGWSISTKSVRDKVEKKNGTHYNGRNKKLKGD